MTENKHCTAELLFRLTQILKYICFAGVVNGWLNSLLLQPLGRSGAR